MDLNIAALGPQRQSNVVHVAPTAVAEVVGLHAMAIIALALVVAKVGPTPNLHHPNMTVVSCSSALGYSLQAHNDDTRLALTALDSRAMAYLHH